MVSISLLTITCNTNAIIKRQSVYSFSVLLASSKHYDNMTWLTYFYFLKTRKAAALLMQGACSLSGKADLKAFIASLESHLRCVQLRVQGWRVVSGSSVTTKKMLRLLVLSGKCCFLSLGSHRLLCCHTGPFIF